MFENLLVAVGGIACGLVSLAVLGFVGFFAWILIKEWRMESRLMSGGRPVLGALLMANSDLYNPEGDPENPGVVVFDDRPPSPERLARLKAVVEQIYPLYAMADEELAGRSEAEQRVGRTLKDHDFQENRRTRIPAELVDGEAIWFADINFKRDRLIEGWSELRAIACMVSGEDEGEIMMLPLDTEQARTLYRSAGLEEAVFAPRKEN